MERTRTREYDDRWMHDAMTRLRVKDALASVEDTYDVACCCVSRPDVERILGRDLSEVEWETARATLREPREERVALLVATVLGERLS